MSAEDSKVFELGDVKILGTLFRDGMQERGAEVSLNSSLNIMKMQSRMGWHYEEVGFAGSNSAADERIKAALQENLNGMKVVAFCRTRGKGQTIKQAKDIRKAVRLGVKVVTLVCKSRLLDVFHSLKTTAEENLAMIFESIKYLKKKGIEVILDLEFATDAYFGRKEKGEKMEEDERNQNLGYFFKVLDTAIKAGADTLVICDTTGGVLQHEIRKMFRDLTSKYPKSIFGVHCHNDLGLAIANTVEAVLAGARHVQGVVNDFGERCGNADLTAVIPLLQNWYDIPMVKPSALTEMRELSRLVSASFNRQPNLKQPFVGSLAATTFAGMHQSGENNLKGIYLPYDPLLVGNMADVGIDKNSGISNITAMALRYGYKLDDTQAKRFIKKNRLNMEFGKYYADASFELECATILDEFKPFFRIEECETGNSSKRTIGKNGGYNNEFQSKAIVKIHIGNIQRHIADNEPSGSYSNMVTAINNGLADIYPQVLDLQLQNYNVVAFDIGQMGVKSLVRCMVSYRSVEYGVSFTVAGISETPDIAGLKAYLEALEYYLMFTKADNKHC